MLTRSSKFFLPPQFAFAMPQKSSTESLSESLQRLAGYLNFSSGTSDPATLAAWNSVYGSATKSNPLSGPAAWLVLKDRLTETLDRLQQESPAFRDVSQAPQVGAVAVERIATGVLGLSSRLAVSSRTGGAIQRIFPRSLCRSVAVGTWGVATTKVIIDETIRRLNDFVGYRPVAMLENRRCEPYQYEFVRPIPLYVRGAGVSAGPYHHVVSLVLEILCKTNPDILMTASFDLERLEELAFDLCAYDFDHPVNRRPNYHFGQWDDRQVSGSGYYTRFVIRQVTMDALLGRVTDHPEIDRELN